MVQRLKFLGVFVAATAIGSFGAAAATVDFTDSSTFDGMTGFGMNTATGSDGGVDFTVTAAGGNLTFNSPFDGTGAAPSPLAGDGDGIGVTDDEISEPNGTAESITVSFNDSVTVTDAYFLDLFESPDQSEIPQERAEVYNGTDTSSGFVQDFDGEQLFSEGGGGFLQGTFDSPVTTQALTFTPTDEDDNDERGVADFALAGLEIQDQPNPQPNPEVIPVPAGGVLLVTALGGLGLLRRRKS